MTKKNIRNDSYMSLRGLTKSTRGNPAICGIASLTLAMTEKFLRLLFRCHCEPVIGRGNLLFIVGYIPEAVPARGRRAPPAESLRLPTYYYFMQAEI